MRLAPRPNFTLSAQIALALAALIVFSAVLVIVTLVLLLVRPSAYTPITEVLATSTGFLVTAVPTIDHRPFATPFLVSVGIPARITQRALLETPDIHATALSSIREPEASRVAAPVIISNPLVDPDISLFAGPVDVPLEIRIPTLNLNAPVIGVGLTLTNMMAAPTGILLDDPIWQTVFWYRGGGIPGNAGTATFAGHLDDAIGRPAVFAYLGDLRIGDLIIIQDERSVLDVPFIVTETQTYNDREAANPAVLARIFGSQSSEGAETQLVSDQLSHLTLITCAGAWNNGSFDLRLVVYATRASYPL